MGKMLVSRKGMKFHRMFFGYGIMFSLLAVAERMRDDIRFIPLLIIAVVLFALSSTDE